MGRPKLKTIDSAIDLDKVTLPEEEVKLKLDEAAEEILQEDTKKKLAFAKKSASSTKTKKAKTRSKKYLEVVKNFEKNKLYLLSEAVELLKKSSYSKFDGTVEAHLNLRIDPAKQEQQIRTTTKLPHGNGKKLRVLVFGAKSAASLKDFGALAGDEETLTQIEKGKLEFDKVVASPEWMPKLAKVAKVLGPKGLMPNPKSGTVSAEPEKTAQELSSGLVEIKTETSPIIHVTIGKISNKASELEENITSLVIAVKNAKPSEVKKELIKDVYLTATMSPSIKLDPASLN